MTSDCPKCLKAEDLCLCGKTPSLKNRLRVLILQHPQEPDKELGSARLAHLALSDSILKVGLSWPNLKAVLGRESKPSNWAVLYLGSGLRNAGYDPRHPEASLERLRPGSIVLVDKKGAPLPDSREIAGSLEGLIVLDGTWSQAKALWWRNAWLLKARRAILVPPRKSLYGELRREPRSECLSTIESIAYGLTALGEDPQVGKSLVDLFGDLLEKFRSSRGNRRPGAAPRAVAGEETGEAPRKRDWRRHRSRRGSGGKRRSKKP